ncbi:MAG TPA: NADH-quinone oxidoreductase subunit M [Prolixibacteraceae bacterium]|nr:NADH-quinone oxidoreductase subunit M [Prolixibacteraceae bacterium]
MLTGLLIFIPLIFSLLLFAMKDHTVLNKKIALAASLFTFAVSVVVLMKYVADPTGYPIYHSDFFHLLGIEFTLGLDGLSMLLVLLTTFLIPLIIYSGFGIGLERRNSFYALILLMEFALIGVFSTTDILMFYIFWEIALIPIFFVSILWGGQNARSITFKFFMYTLVGGLFMLVAIIYIYVQTPGPHSFAFSDFYKVILDPSAQKWLFLAFFLAFAIKMPIFPFHTWQPDLYFTAPTQGTMLLAGIMLKMGVYGVIRFVLPLFPDALNEYSFYAMLLSVTGIVYASIIAIRQNELKRLIAYSSLAHVGLIAAGLFSRTFNGLEGAMIQMISHGVNIVGLFFCYEIIVRRTKTGEIASLGGIAAKAPVFAGFFMIILLGSVSLPLTNSFVGEFLLLLGVFEYNSYLAAVAGLTIILGAVYMLWMYQRTMYGGTNEITEGFTDLTRQEIILLVPVVAIILWIGIYPQFFLELAEPAVKSILSVH